jgi:hypothetical protein
MICSSCRRLEDKVRNRKEESRRARENKKTQVAAQNRRIWLETEKNKDPGEQERKRLRTQLAAQETKDSVRNRIEEGSRRTREKEEKNTCSCRRNEGFS